MSDHALVTEQAVPSRIRFALSVLGAGPAERILEVGCGPGVAADELCAVLESGRLVATDRSATALGRAARRNGAHLDSGRLELIRTALAELSRPAGEFDAAFAIDVNLFWTGCAAAELAVVRRVLRRGGRLVIAYGHGPQEPSRVTDAVAAALGAAGFVAIEMRLDTSGFVVTAVS